MCLQEAFWTQVLEGRSSGGEGGTMPSKGGTLLAWIYFPVGTIIFLKLRLHEKASDCSHKSLTLELNPVPSHLGKGKPGYR